MGKMFTKVLLFFFCFVAADVEGMKYLAVRNETDSTVKLKKIESIHINILYDNIM